MTCEYRSVILPWPSCSATMTLFCVIWSAALFPASNFRVAHLTGLFVERPLTFVERPLTFVLSDPRPLR